MLRYNLSISFLLSLSYLFSTSPVQDSKLGYSQVNLPAFLLLPSFLTLSTRLESGAK